MGPLARGMSAGEFLGWMGQHCTAGSHQQSAQHTTPTLPLAPEGLRDAVQDPGHTGMFSQEHSPFPSPGSKCCVGRA